MQCYLNHITYIHISLLIALYRFGLLSSTWNTNFLGTVTANVLYSTVSVEFSVKIFPDIMRSDMVFAGNKYKGHKSIVRNGVFITET